MSSLLGHLIKRRGALVLWSGCLTREECRTVPCRWVPLWDTCRLTMHVGGNCFGSFINPESAVIYWSTWAERCWLHWLEVGNNISTNHIPHFLQLTPHQHWKILLKIIQCKYSNHWFIDSGDSVQSVCMYSTSLIWCLEHPFQVRLPKETVVSSAPNRTAAQCCQHLGCLQPLCIHDQVHNCV